MHFSLFNMNHKINLDDVIETPQKAFDYVISRVFTDKTDRKTRKFLSRERKAVKRGDLRTRYQQVLDFAVLLYSNITNNNEPFFEFSAIPRECRGDAQAGLKEFLTKYYT